MPRATRKAGEAGERAGRARWRLPLARRRFLWLIRNVGVALAAIAAACGRRAASVEVPKEDRVIALPEPTLTGTMPLEEALLRRRSVRDYALDPLTLAEVSQLLWAAQGITDPRGFRTAPSAGATYPLELYVAVGVVERLEAGVYKYAVGDHALHLVAVGDPREALAAAALTQTWVLRAPLSLVFAALPARTTQRYGHRGHQYVHIEVGHVSQNVYLQAVALGLATVAVGAFYDEQVKRVCAMSSEERPLYIMPLGHPVR